MKTTLAKKKFKKCLRINTVLPYAGCALAWDLWAENLGFMAAEAVQNPQKKADPTEVGSAVRSLR